MKKQEFHNVFAWAEEESHLEKIQSKYLDYLPKGGRILDLGSGRGVFLELLKDNGFKPIGVEVDETMYELSKRKGYEVVKSDAVSFLKKNKETFDGVLASHIIEHLTAAEGVELIELIKRNLKKNGIAIVVTPRPGSLWAAENFWLDSTHVRPFPLALLKELFQPLEIVASGIEPDSIPTKNSNLIKKIVLFFRKLIIGEQLYDFVYGGGVSFIIAKKNA